MRTTYSVSIATMKLEGKINKIYVVVRERNDSDSATRLFSIWSFDPKCVVCTVVD